MPRVHKRGSDRLYRTGRDVRGTWLFFDPPAGEDSGDVAADNAVYERVDQRALGCAFGKDQTT